MNGQVGLIGLGLLGSAISQRLLDSGKCVVGFDLNTQSTTAFEKRGGAKTDDAKSVFETCDTVIFCLPNSNVSLAVIEECSEAIDKNHLVIDTTTGRPDDAVSNGKRLVDLGAEFVEANVAANSQQMLDGTAVLFLGGNEESIERASSCINILASRTYRLGKLGSASKMKLIHNLVLGLNRAVLAEALNFADDVGIDQATALNILANSPANSGVMKTKGQKMVEKDFEPQAKLAQHRKDVQLILDTVSDQKKLALSELHLQLLLECESQGLGEMDNSAIVLNQRGNAGSE